MRRIAVLAAAAAFALAGCGGDDEPAATPAPAATEAPTEAPATATEAAEGASSTLKIAADPGGAKKFTETTLTADAGTVTVEFANDSQLPHAVEIEGNGVEAKTDVVTKSDASVSADLKPGTYEFYCPVGDHKAEGMKGKLTGK
jgi:plastocyanin